MRHYRRRGFTVLELLIVIVVIALIAAIAVPALLSAQRTSNERSASTSMRTFTIALNDFRGNDRDGDRTQNYWIRDLYSLHALCPSTNGTTPPTPSVDTQIKLIDAALAAADGSGQDPVAGALPPSQTVGAWTPKATYVFRQFINYEGAGASTVAYGATTQGSIGAYGNAWNYTKFGVMACPVSYTTGRKVYIVCETGTIWQATPTADYDATFAGGTGTAATLTINSGFIGGVAWTVTTAFPNSPGSLGFGKLD
jgi:prepilin-type N-terminal cleavage/methylation domain-containing protein